MTAWILALLIQSAQAQTITTVADYPVHYRVTAGYVNGSIAPVNSITAESFPTISHKLSRGFSAGHSGIDIDGNAGDLVVAWQGGTVEEVTTSGPYGNKVVVRHSATITTVYAHLQSISVVPGEAVRSGTQVGTLGSTGRATGSHLHFEIRENNQAIDALPFIQ